MLDDNLPNITEHIFETALLITKQTNHLLVEIFQPQLELELFGM